jgi:hypothetical protein
MARSPKRPRPGATPSEHAVFKSDVEKLARQSRVAIQVVAGLLVVVFTFIAVSGKDVKSWVDVADSGVVYKIGLFIYYSCWVFGAKFDVDIEERVYIRDNLHGVLDWKAFGVIAILTAVMAGFFALHPYERLFPVGLAAFIGVNYLGWRTVCRRIAGPIAESIRYYEQLGDYLGSVKVRMVEDYMCGRWQAWRLAAMAAMAIALSAAANSGPYYGLAALMRSFLPEGLDSRKLAELLPALLFIFYVLAAEAWMWVRRANVHVCVKVIERLGRDYKLEPRGTG